jgi:mycothiol synthase
MAIRLRPFTPDDWPAAIEIGNRIFPDAPRSLEGALHWDARWEDEKYYRERLVAEDEMGRVIGRASLNHLPWQFSPDSYAFSAEVDPAHQRKGVGSTLYEALLETARQRSATLIRSGTKESKPESLAFLEHRGFEEIQRSWESRLDVHGFDFSAFATAEPRVREQGLVVTTLEAELAAAGGAETPEGETTMRAVYALDCECTEDEPSFAPVTMPRYEKWRDDTLSSPNLLRDAYFLMKDGDRYVGLSELGKNLALPHVLQQGFTAVARSHRGRGVAMALKIRGARYAKERGYVEIRTGNNTRNRPMLRINEAMGFVKQPVEIELAKRL